MFGAGGTNPLQRTFCRRRSTSAVCAPGMSTAGMDIRVEQLAASACAAMMREGGQFDRSRTESGSALAARVRMLAQGRSSLRGSQLGGSRWGRLLGRAGGTSGSSCGGGSVGIGSDGKSKSHGLGGDSSTYNSPRKQSDEGQRSDEPSVLSLSPLRRLVSGEQVSMRSSKVPETSTSLGRASGEDSLKPPALALSPALGGVGARSASSSSETSADNLQRAVMSSEASQRTMVSTLTRLSESGSTNNASSGNSTPRDLIEQSAPAEPRQRTPRDSTQFGASSPHRSPRPPRLSLVTPGDRKSVV